jgi:hypothetical protein
VIVSSCPLSPVASDRFGVTSYCGLSFTLVFRIGRILSPTSAAT